MALATPLLASFDFEGNGRPWPNPPDGHKGSDPCDLNLSRSISLCSEMLITPLHRMGVALVEFLCGRKSLGLPPPLGNFLQAVFAFHPLMVGLLMDSHLPGVFPVRPGMMLVKLSELATPDAQLNRRHDLIPFPGCGLGVVEMSVVFGALDISPNLDHEWLLFG